MSKEALVEFATKVRADEPMARDLAEVVGTRQAAAADAVVAAFAQSQGFEVTPEDVVEMRRAASRAGPAEGELDDAELESVAAGFVPHGGLIVGGAPTPHGQDGRHPPRGGL